MLRGVGIQASVVLVMTVERRKNSTVFGCCGWRRSEGGRETNRRAETMEKGRAETSRGLFKRSVGLRNNCSCYDDSVEGVSLLKSMERSTRGGGQGSGWWMNE